MSNLDDDDDDVRECPHCGAEQVYTGDWPVCDACGEPLDGDDDEDDEDHDDSDLTDED